MIPHGTTRSQWVNYVVSLSWDWIDTDSEESCYRTQRLHILWCEGHNNDCSKLKHFQSPRKCCVYYLDWKYIYIYNIYNTTLIYSSKGKTIVFPIQKLKQKFGHFDKISIIGCTGSCHFDNFHCSQWWEFHQNEDISASAKKKIPQDYA